MALDHPTANPITPGSPQGIPGQHQAYSASQGGWAVAWASRVGHRHAVHGMPCEDSVAACWPASGGLHATVADGVSGSDLGAWASRVYADYVTDLRVAYPPALDYAPDTRLAAQYTAAQAAMTAQLHRAETVVQRTLANQAPGCTGAATTAGVWLGADGLGWYNRMGDCRIYHLRQHCSYVELTRLTQDQTFNNINQKPPGGIPADNPCHMMGGGCMGELEICSIQLHPGDALLLCTDGVHSLLSDAALAKHLTRGARRGHSLLTLCKSLLRLARLQGNTDDMAALLVHRLG